MNDFTLQIISKYLNYRDTKNLMLIDEKVNKYFKENTHTTFNYININVNYIMPKHQIFKLINKLLFTFPNLEEIILNFESNTFLSNFENILITVNNFEKCIKNINKNINVKVKFNGIFELFHKEDVDIVEKVAKYFKSQTIYIYIWKFGHFDKLNEKLLDILKFKNINYVINISTIKFKKCLNINISNKYLFSDNLYFTYHSPRCK